MLTIEGIGFNKANNNKQVSFAGHNLISNDNGKKVYRFFIPKVNYDNARVILKVFDLDDNGNIDIDTQSEPKTIDIPKNQPYVDITPKQDINLPNGKILGYKFVIDGKDYTDKHRFVDTVSDGRFNIADILASDVLSTPKTIYHLIPTTFNPKLGTNADKTARMNHFLKYDASIQNIIDKIPHIKSMGFRRILSTPIFGQDNLSSHGYWTANPFQITQRLGNINDFKNLQETLFKNSMGFIADGAFTNEGLMGIHIRDIVRHGENSPFKHWFELYNFPTKTLKFGILPDKSSSYSHFEIKVVNSPVIWNVKENGKPAANFGTPNARYNPNKETFIQIYDKRLASREQILRDEVFSSYAIKNPKNPDDITTWMDSVQPYSFPVNAKEVVKKAIAAKNSDMQAKEFLTAWENFEITTAKNSAGVLLWVGNKDIAKLRFVFPNTKKKDVLNNAATPIAGANTINDIQEATENVRDYIVNVGQFWTNKTAKILREYIANQLGNISSESDFLNTINAKAGKSLPESVKYITSTQLQNALNDKYEAISNLQLPLTIEDALDEYPYEALEVNDDLTSIFAYPAFKENAKSILNPQLVKITTNILQTIDKNNELPYKFFNNGKLNLDTMKVIQLVTDDIKRFILIKGLSPNYDFDDIFSTNKENYEKLRDINATGLGLTSNSTSELADKLTGIIKANLSQLYYSDMANIVDYIQNKLHNITPNNLKVADLIIDKTESGLNWRIDAAKDIADIEGFNEDECSIEETWGEIFDFWKSFNDGVKLYNAHAYKIGEFTDTDVTYSEISDKMPNSGVIEDKLVEKTGFTTQSNYNYMFDTPQYIYSGMSEKHEGYNVSAAEKLYDKLIVGWAGVPGYLASGNKNNISYSHAATGNHDKPRMAHSFILNTRLAYEKWEEAKAEVRNDLLASSIDKSKYFNYVQSDNLAGIFNTVSPQNFAKLAAYSDAFAQAVNSAPNKDSLRVAFANALDSLVDNKSLSSKSFYYKNFEATYEDILVKIQEQNPTVKDEVKNMQALVHEKLTEPARYRGLEVAKLMVALPCNPTLYAGDELLELGGEEKAKNVSVQNRNRLHWEYLSDNAYQHVQSYKENLSKIYNLRNDENLSSLVNGDTVLLKNQGKDNSSDRDVMALYRYNDHDDSIILIHNNGYNAYRKFNPRHTVILGKIDLSGGGCGYKKDDPELGGLPGRLKAGSEFVDALNTNKKYIVGDDGYLYNFDKLGDNFTAQPITLNSTVTILKRIK